MKHELRWFLSTRWLLPRKRESSFKESISRGPLSLHRRLNQLPVVKGCSTLRALALTLISFQIIACEQAKVAEELDQRGAHEVVAALGRSGITATMEKQRGAKGQYAVLVDSARFNESIAVLTDQGLPSPRKTSFAEIVSSGGILPSSKQSEALRLDRALAAEIEELLRGHPGVAEASVVVRFHAIGAGNSAAIPLPVTPKVGEGEHGVDGEAVPAVSMIVQRRTPQTVQLEEIRQLVGRVVPGVRPSEIVISLTEKPLAATPQVNHIQGESSNELVPFLIFWRVSRESYNVLVLVVLAFLGTIGALAGFLGYIFGQYVLTRQLESEDPMRLDGARRYPELGGGVGDTEEDDG